MSAATQTLWLALGSAFLYGLSAQLVRLGLAHLDARAGVAISSGATALAYLTLSPLWLNMADLLNPGLLIFVVFGLFHPLLSRYMAYEANRRVGATVSSTFESAGPLLSVALAVVLLGERPDLLSVLGTLMAVAGGLYLYWHPAVARALMRSAVLLALGAMLLRSSNNIVAKVGLGLVPNPLMAAFVTYTVSWTFATVFLRLRHVPVSARGPGSFRAGVAWFALVGVITAGGSGCLYAALLHGEVSVVAPVMSGYAFFVMAIGWTMGIERLTARNALGVAVVVAGVVLVSIQAMR